MTTHSATRRLLMAACLAVLVASSEALLIGNFIGCNSFGCRLSALESDVAQLKQTVSQISSRLNLAGGSMNFQQLPYNQQNPSGMGGMGNQQQGGQMSNFNPNNMNQQQQRPQQQQQQGGGQMNFSPAQQTQTQQQQTQPQQQQQSGQQQPNTQRAMSIGPNWAALQPNNPSFLGLQNYQGQLVDGQQF
jgi:hypothetical protein